MNFYRFSGYIFLLRSLRQQDRVGYTATKASTEQGVAKDDAEQGGLQKNHSLITSGIHSSKRF